MKGVLEKAIQNRIIKTILAAAIVFILTYAIAAEMSISSVSYLGGGEADVTAPASINKVSWSIKTPAHGNPGQKAVVDNVTLNFTTTLQKDTKIYVEILDGSECG